MLPLRCPLDGCLGGDINRTNLRVHSVHRHVRDTIVILEEGNQPYPWCPKCDMFVLHKALNSWVLVKVFYQGEGGKEVAPPVRVRCVGGDRDNDHIIRDPPCPVRLLQVPWENLLGVGRRLAIGGTQPLEGTSEVGAYV